jgi:hypothetical protein
MEYALKFVAMGKFLNLLAMTVIIWMETAVHQNAAFKIDIHALMKISQLHQYAGTIRNTSNFNSKTLLNLRAH